MPIDDIAADSGPDMAEYHRLMNKANLLYGQGQAVAQVAGQLHNRVAEMRAHWRGKRADRFEEEWNKTNAMLSGWANDLVQLSEDIKVRADEILAE